MDIASIRHKGLLTFAESGRTKGLPAKLTERLRNMLAYLNAIDAVDDLWVPPNFGGHRLTGDRKGEWSLTVSKNWRMTFRVNEVGAIEDLNLEDYH